MTDIDAVALSPEEEAAIRRVVPEWQASAAVAPEREFVHIIAALVVTLDVARADRDGLREAALELLYALDGLGPMDIRNAKTALRAALTAEAGPRT